MSAIGSSPTGHQANRHPHPRPGQLHRHEKVVLNPRRRLKPTEVGLQRRGNWRRTTTPCCHWSRTPGLRAGLRCRRGEMTPGHGRHSCKKRLGQQNLRHFHVPQLGVPLQGRHGRATALRRALRCLHPQQGPPGRGQRGTKWATSVAGGALILGRLPKGRRCKATPLRWTMQCLHPWLGPRSQFPGSTSM